MSSLELSRPKRKTGTPPPASNPSVTAPRVDRQLFMSNVSKNSIMIKIRLAWRTGFRNAGPNPHKIHDILKSLYGSKKPFVVLQQCFYDHRKHEGESLTQFSHALMSQIISLTVIPM